MSQAVWRFERTVQETVEALRDVIQRDEGVRASQVRGEWSYRAQLLLEPAGWDALWRVPKDTCRRLGTDTRFPLVVYVTVEGLDLEGGEAEEGGGLRASLQVLGVQDEAIRLPLRHEGVPLEQLWPLRAQPNSAMHIRPTAEFIDLYRYFYTMIWMEWDLDTDDECGWFERHVAARCALWAAALGGRPGAPAPTELRALRHEASQLAAGIARAQQDLPSDTEDNALDCSGEQMSELVMLHNRLQQVRSRWESLQNPPLRMQPLEENLPPQNIVIWMGGTVEDHISCLRRVSEMLPPGASVQCAPSLDAALCAPRPPPHSHLLLCSGPHPLPDHSPLGDHYTITSVDGDATLMCTEDRTTGVATRGPASLSRLRLDAARCSTALAVRAARAALAECRLAAGHQDAQGVVVHRGAELDMAATSVDGFFTGIVAHSRSTVRLVDCTLSNCGVGLQVYAGAKVTLVRCVFKDYVEAAIRYETSGIAASEGGCSSLLLRYSDITFTDCKFFNNGINEVFIARLDENACPEWDSDTVSTF